jgi:hypothetical protein
MRKTTNLYSSKSMFREESPPQQRQRQLQQLKQLIQRLQQQLSQQQQQPRLEQVCDQLNLIEHLRTY